MRVATIETLVVGVDDAAIVDLVRTEEPARVAIDAPFGWPAPFVAAVSQHASGGAWDAPAFRPLRLRTTDLNVIAETGGQPLSVSADRIAVTAFRCAGLLSQLATAGHRVGRAGDGLVVEAYPAGALRQWGLDQRGYKAASRNNRAAVHSSSKTTPSAPLPFSPSLKSNGRSSPPVTICSMHSLALGAVEGWIALPHPDSLSELERRDRL